MSNTLTYVCERMFKVNKQIKYTYVKYYLLLYYIRAALVWRLDCETAKKRYNTCTRETVRPTKSSIFETRRFPRENRLSRIQFRRNATTKIRINSLYDTPQQHCAIGVYFSRDRTVFVSSKCMGIGMDVVK